MFKIEEQEWNVVALDDPCHIKLPEATLLDLYHVYFYKAYNTYYLNS